MKKAVMLMKKAFLWIVTLCMLFSTTGFTAYAVSQTVTLPALGLDVTLPHDYEVITRDTPSDDPLFSMFGTTRDEMLAMFEERNIYLNALPSDATEEVVVTMIPNAFRDLSSMDEAVLDAYMDEVVGEFETVGYTISARDYYEHPQTLFVKLYSSDAANTVHVLQYYTVHDYKAMNFTMRSYSGPITAAQEATIRQIVDSIRYSEGGDSTVQSYVYTDFESSLCFTIPEHWKQDTLEDESGLLDAQFTCDTKPGHSIIYGSVDIWSMLPAEERDAVSREEYTTSLFTKEDAAEMFGVTADEVSMVTYNGQEYFKASPAVEDAEGFVFTQLLSMDNGWMYMFQFLHPENADNGDFEQLMQSVRYNEAITVPPATDATAPTKAPAVTTPPENATTSATKANPTDEKTDTMTALLPWIIGAAIAAAVAAAIVAVCMIRRHKSSKAACPPIAQVCKTCGNTLAENDLFCGRCGTKRDE